MTKTRVFNGCEGSRLCTRFHGQYFGPEVTDHPITASTQQQACELFAFSNSVHLTAGALPSLRQLVGRDVNGLSRSDGRSFKCSANAIHGVTSDDMDALSGRTSDAIPILFLNHATATADLTRGTRVPDEPQSRDSF